MNILKIFDNRYFALYKFREDCETLNTLRIPFVANEWRMQINVGGIIIFYDTVVCKDKFKGMEYSDIIFDDYLNITEEDRAFLLARKRNVK